MRSDAGRLWASRERPIPAVAEQAGACRTVDGDDLVELCQAIARQESIAEQRAPELGVSWGQNGDAARVRPAVPVQPG
ncbi:hypothetical protein GCM10023074_72280 [Microbispora amethystogenes]|uniref:Uncharacterized protein n=2 Tax=Microbispora amethystogenes TaxID=1427754 RepID=A0ABQ4FQ79_9ACTN|nr:hypothetical protein Mam01_71390 [Microbispora amethystogenes]